MIEAISRVASDPELSIVTSLPLPTAAIRPAVPETFVSLMSPFFEPMARSAVTSEFSRLTPLFATREELKTDAVAVREPEISTEPFISTEFRTSEATAPSALVIVPANEGYAVPLAFLALPVMVRFAPSARIMLFSPDENPFSSTVAGLLKVKGSATVVVSLAMKTIVSLSFSSEATASLRLPKVRSSPFLTI